MLNAKEYTMVKYLKILPLKVVGWFSRMRMFGKLPQVCNGELKLIIARRQGAGDGISKLEFIIAFKFIRIQRNWREKQWKDISGPISII